MSWHMGKPGEHAPIRGSVRPSRSTHCHNLAGTTREAGNGRRTAWKAIQEARILAHRARVEAECERLGIVQGTSLFVCVFCVGDTIGPPAQALQKGWEPSGDGGWLCRACARRGGAKFQG